MGPAQFAGPAPLCVRRTVRALAVATGTAMGDRR
jgi:hypothetical protein